MGVGGRPEEEELNEVWFQKEVVLNGIPLREKKPERRERSFSPTSVVWHQAQQRLQLPKGRPPRMGQVWASQQHLQRGWHAHLVRGSREPGWGLEHLLQAEGPSF